MKISSHIRSHRTQAAYRGFTLIELLVVISIIAVLAGLLFPAMGAVRNMARKTSAKNDVTQIVNAVKMFYTEYGRYPLVVSTGQFTSNNGSLMDILRVGNPTSPSENVTKFNPRKIRFLEIPNAKNDRSGLKLSGSGTTAAPSADADWLDPWGTPYQVFVSPTYETLGTISVKAYKNKTLSTVTYTVNSEVAAASSGNPEAGTAEAIGSW